MIAVCAAFWRPAIARMGRSGFPAPLDDVYIYFDFARATAEGCVLCWTSETGYSSGATSPPYALLLAALYALGLRGEALGLGAGLVALGALWDLTGSFARLAGRSWMLGALAACLVLAIPLLDWTWVSGMEAAFAGALLGRAIVAVQRARAAAASGRRDAELRAGAWLALAAWARPECVPVALALGVAVAHASGSMGAALSLARASAPTGLVVASSMLVNRVLTGEASPAGAVRKLVLSDPYAPPLKKAIVVLQNLVRLVTEGLEGGLGGPWSVRLLVVLGLASLLHRTTRAVGLALLAGAASALVLVCSNTTAPFQNYRYLAPTLLLLLAAAVLGLRALALRSRGIGAVGAVVALGIAAAAAREFPRQILHFSRSAANIEGQQVEVGRKLAAMSPRPSRVFVGDAGAIPYFSGLRALDGLGLGGDHALPFARASVHGVPAVVELVERLAPNDRPDVLAIYDGWWGSMPQRFAKPLFSVRIEDNVMCADPVKSVHRADWSLLEERTPIEGDVLDAIDVADLVDERAHELAFTSPEGGYVVESVARDEKGSTTWDAARELRRGQWLELSLLPRESVDRARLVVRTDARAIDDRGEGAQVEHRGARVELVPRDATAPIEVGSWLELEATLEGVSAGDRVTIHAESGLLRVFSVRLERAR